MEINIQTVEALLSMLGSVASFLAKYGPNLLVGAEKIVEALKLAFKAAIGGPLTPELQTQIDNTLDEADKALTDALVKAEAQDAADAAANEPPPVAA